MKYYIEVQNGIVIMGGSTFSDAELNENQIEVDFEFYSELHFPSEIKFDGNGTILEVIPIIQEVIIEPTPPEPTVEDYMMDLDLRLTLIELGM